MDLIQVVALWSVREGMTEATNNPRPGKTRIARGRRLFSALTSRTDRLDPAVHTANC